MSRRYEFDAVTATNSPLIELHGPAATWWTDDADEEQAAGRHALVIGNPYGSAYAILGALADLEGFAAGLWTRIRWARERYGELDGPAVVFDSAAFRAWLAQPSWRPRQTNAENLSITGRFHSDDDNAGAMVEGLLDELRDNRHPQVWRTTGYLHAIHAWRTCDGEGEDGGAVFVVDLGAGLRLSTNHLAYDDFTTEVEMDHADTAAAALAHVARVVNDTVARHRAATSPALHEAAGVSSNTPAATGPVEDNSAVGSWYKLRWSTTESHGQTVSAHDLAALLCLSVDDLQAADPDDIDSLGNVELLDALAEIEGNGSFAGVTTRKLDHDGIARLRRCERCRDLFEGVDPDCGLCERCEDYNAGRVVL